MGRFLLYGKMRRERVPSARAKTVRVPGGRLPNPYLGHRRDGLTRREPLYNNLTAGDAARVVWLANHEPISSRAGLTLAHLRRLLAGRLIEPRVYERLHKALAKHLDVVLQSEPHTSARAAAFRAWLKEGTSA